jgi:hypothetical protein
MDPQLLALAPAAFENLYHVGYLVPDVRAAMATFGELLAGFVAFGRFSFTIS